MVASFLHCSGFILVALFAYHHLVSERAFLAALRVRYNVSYKLCFLLRCGVVSSYCIVLIRLAFY
jgi:hypothetical protein